MKIPKTPDKIKPSQFSKFLPEYVEYAERVRKTLYYGRLPATDRPSLPFTSLSVEKFSELCRQDGLDRLDMRYASSVCYDACVTPCSLILALMYLDRLRTHNPEYLATTSPSQVFLVAMMVASKYLYDDGEEDEVFNDEWATSASLPLTDLNQAEREFLMAIDWDLFVDFKAFLRAFENVESDLAWQEGQRRGYFTYTDLQALTNSLPASCTSLLHLVSHVLAVCVVGYTAAVVSVIAGTLLAHECSQHVTSAMSRLTSDLLLTNETAERVVCPDEGLLSREPGHVGDPLNLLGGKLEAPLEIDKGNVTLSGLPSHALTTLTTSILLAMSSPSVPHQGHSQHKNNARSHTGRCRSVEDDSNCEDDREDYGKGYDDSYVFDPSDTRLAFTTGAYWPPSSWGRRNSNLPLNHVSLELPNMGLPLMQSLSRDQKEDWVYWNPWVIPWLSWHGSPVYGILCNFSGIGAPNVGGIGKHEGGWAEWLAWMGQVMQETLADILPNSPGLSFPPPPILSRGVVAFS